jgi:MFS family permease
MRCSPSPLRRSLRACTFDGIFFSAMVGLGDYYFAAFALFLGADAFEVGVLTTVPMLLGAGFQLLSPAGAHRFGVKRWVVGSAVLQALVFLPVATLPWTVANGYAWLLPCVCLYWMLGLGLSPAWNAWIARMIPAAVRSRYFGRRNAPIFSSLLLAGLSGGMLLHVAKTSAWGVEWGFLAVFLLAASFRLASAWCMSRQIEPRLDPETVRAPRAGLREGLRSGPHRRLILLLVAMTGSVHLTAAYFTPFMLTGLRLSYAEFTLLNSAVLVARALSSPYWGEIARTYGNRRALQVAAFLVVPLSGLWVVSHDFYYLLAVQLFAGFAWAGVDLTNMLNFFDCTDDRNRADVLSVYNLCNGAAIVTGATIGGLVLRRFGPAAYPVLFLGSSLLRLVVVILLARGVGVRRAKERTFREVFLRVLTFARAGART